jgi:hypothetical protein
MNISAKDASFTRTNANETGRGMMTLVGSVAGEVLVTPGTATASATESRTHIRLLQSTDTITVTLPTPLKAGMVKLIIMDNPGVATIVGGAQTVILTVASQAAWFTWSGSEWVTTFGSSGTAPSSVPDSFDFLAVNAAYLQLVKVYNSGSLVGSFNNGNGFFVTQDGYAASAAHVVLNEQSDIMFGFADLYVHVINYNGTGQHIDVWVPSSAVIGCDGNADVAVFKVPGITNQAFFTWGDTRSLLRGEAVYLVGNPSSADFSSINRASVKDPKYWDYNMKDQDVLFVDSGIGGNSGGPVLDGQSRVVGIMSFTSTIECDPYAARTSAATVTTATTSAIDAVYTNGPPGTLSGTVNNVPLTMDMYTFTGADVGVTTFLVTEGTYNSVTPTEPSPNYQTNGVYLFTAVETAGSPWQAVRTTPLTQADIVASGGRIQGAGPLVNSPDAVMTIYVETGGPGSKANTYQSLLNSIVQIDAPLRDNLIFQDSSVLGVYSTKQEGTLASATSQYQAQPIVEQIIAGNRLSPAPNPFLNSVFVYNQKGWLGCTFAAWTTENPLRFQNFWSMIPAMTLPVFGAMITFVDQGGVSYPIGAPPVGGPAFSPIEVAFDNAFGAPPGLFAAIVSGNWIAPYPIPLVVYSIDGQRVGTQDTIEVPISQVMYANPPGTTVDLVLVDPLGLLFGPPGTGVQFPVTLGTKPVNLETAAGRSHVLPSKSTPIAAPVSASASDYRSSLDMDRVKRLSIPIPRRR